ncbi:microbial collagenase [Streptomyces qinglanensis]|uniref:microbial collagenase n=1 Tax=Streptomyces qinglanensis TaxID=943816 RepID=A0A1H9WG46_9ACTN|nr:collagenase [Streptomyces qinglanensis]SES32739.1 microbial collagenase [Streptomyces qinglanensis]
MLCRGRRTRNLLRSHLIRAVGAGTLALSLAAGAAQLGGTPARAAAPGDSARDVAPHRDSGPRAVRTGEEPEHIQGRRLEVADRAPLPASPDRLRTDYDSPAPRPPRERPSARLAPADGHARAACSPGDFARTGAALVEQITSTTTDCVNSLFGLTGSDAHGAFREEQMVTAADALRSRSASYPGDGSTGMPQLVLFLRAGYYVHWYHEQDVGAYGPELKSALRGGLDAFFGSQHSRDVTDANGETLSEAVTLIDSAEENAHYLGVVRRMLTGYDSSYDDKYWMVNAVNNAYGVLWRGHQMPGFVRAVQRDPRVLATLHTFARDHLGLLNGEHYFLTYNAGRELGRFLQHASLRRTVRPLVKDLLDASDITGDTAALWVGVAEMADAYDRDRCAYYGVCDLKGKLTRAVLTDRKSCSDSITMVAQDMSAQDFRAACDSLEGQDAYFHRVARDSGPVADDRNSSIEVVVFDSSRDYRIYAGALYGIDTDNGGMYLEGDPSAAGNLPRFLAYEAEWLRPDFRIWNLNHEYTHYLDGRFDMYGDFEAGTSTPTVWWIEGFAEYVSYSYRRVRYDAAIDRAGSKTYPLSTLFDTTYQNTDTDRTYRWGYLAVRYMLEEHPGAVDAVLASYRTGAWDTARRYLKEAIGSRYDQDWYTWLDACAAGGCTTG